MILKPDCRHFPGDRPCIYNKTEGVKCDNCIYYSPVSMKILIIKLDAAGDVLRTTSILSALKRKYPESFITWITKKNSEMIFKNNEMVDELLFLEDHSLVPRLLSRKFDLMIHPDASPVSSSLAALVNASEKKGFTVNEAGKVIPLNPEAEEWFEMGAFDEYKKRNKKTYQQILHEIAGLEYRQDEIILKLDSKEKEFARNFFLLNNLKAYNILIGLNTGASKRWPLKQWHLEKYEELIKILSHIEGTGILLYGGPEEADRNEILTRKFPNIIDTGSDNSLREFFALLDLSDLVITGDTLALHAAAALKKNVICLFGPTSSAEIESYGRIRKIVPDMECLVCYKNQCDFVPNCMDLITPEMLMKEITSLYPEINQHIKLRY